MDDWAKGQTSEENYGGVGGEDERWKEAVETHMNNSSSHEEKTMYKKMYITMYYVNITINAGVHNQIYIPM